jgi:hypothetical protein
VGACPVPVGEVSAGGQASRCPKPRSRSTTGSKGGVLVTGPAASLPGLAGELWPVARLLPDRRHQRSDNAFAGLVAIADQTTALPASSAVFGTADVTEHPLRSATDSRSYRPDPRTERRLHAL